MIYNGVGVSVCVSVKFICWRAERNPYGKRGAVRTVTGGVVFLVAYVAAVVIIFVVIAILKSSSVIALRLALSGPNNSGFFGA